VDELEEPGEDVLETGRRSPRWERFAARTWTYRYAVGMLAGVALLIALLVAIGPDGTVAGHASSAIRHPLPTTSPARVHPRGYDALIVAVRELALQRAPLGIYERQDAAAGDCALVTPGHSPRHRVSRLIRRAAPRYRLQDTGEVLDQFAGLCLLQVRLRSPGGDVLVARIASAVASSHRSVTDQVQTGFEVTPHETTKYALVRLHGFEILVGATGRPRGLPAAATLVALAQDPALTW